MNHHKTDFSKTKNHRKILFVCTYNIDRSRTAEDIYSTRQDLEVKSAGTSEYAATTLNNELLEWANEVYVMEDMHMQYIKTSFPQHIDKTVVLNIYDSFKRGNPLLVNLLQEKLKNKI